ncbi:SDR family NAD(P)-dependent oxidoreductase [Kordiimonas sp. SCSIO 12610]|uniref:SDR family NAD(P)-dependent oxidoreductase n=1 Tax=Kordiimonas sp. SCSIO 12610 TaxID=2829597 RepID=UPI00210F16CA|nr:SDR family NAD(P)-dependent oxidoreductase [Kordiimonas sp. SCSIO 12610]
MKNSIAVIGASGAIGRSFIKALHNRYPMAQIHGFSRNEPTGLNNYNWHPIDIVDEASIENAANNISAPLDLIIIATGILHNQTLQPEKSLRDLSAQNFEQVFRVNTIGPALIAKHFLPKLNKKNRSIFAPISARVGRIEDNRLGGWYAYRASKTALNMILKNASIEIARRNKEAIIVGLHPGTVDSGLSQPFQGSVATSKLFTPDYSTIKMLDVIDGLTPADTGQVFDFNGIRVPA